MRYLRLTLSLLKRHKIASALVALSFFGGIFLGFMLPSELKLAIFKLLFAKINDLITKDKSLNFIQIFVNNAFVGLLLIILGFTILLPILIILLNGIAIGVVTDLFFRLLELKLSTMAILIGSILPHGIIEILALLMSSIFGVLLGLKLFFKKKIEKRHKLKDLFVKILKIYIIVLIPMFFAAALIESFVTPFIGGGLTESLLAGRSSSEKLEPVILNLDNFSNLGLSFKEITLNEYLSRFPEIRKFDYLSTIISLFYDDEMHKEIARFANNPGITKIYLNEKNNSTLLIEIAELPSNDDAKLWLQASDKILNITLTENNIDFALIGEHLYKISQENKIRKIVSLQNSKLEAED